MESIARMMKELPENYEAECFKQGAIVRRRGVNCPANLMMLSLFHLQNGCSLLEISEVARITKLGKMSDVAFMNRFKQCGNWFKAINNQLASDYCWINYKKPLWLEGKDVVAVDASDVKEKGRSGRIYRLHFALDIFKMTSVEHKITTNTVGESLCNFALRAGQLLIADRGYSTIKGVMHCNENGAECILRLRKNSFTLRDDKDQKIEFFSLLEALSDEDVLDLSSFATNLKGDKIPIRICAQRKTPEAIFQTKKKLKRTETLSQRTISDDTKSFNEYIVVMTTLDTSISAKEVLETYRLRWQIEIYFKRLKSILDFGELPKRNEESVFAWLNGKLMVALLIEKVVANLSFFPKE